MANAGELFVKLGLDMSMFAKGLEDAKNRLNSSARDWGSIGISMSAAFTAPLLAIGGASLAASADFEKALNKIEALAYDSSTPIKQVNEEMAKMSQLAMKLGQDTIFSAKEVADAMGEMAAAGFSASQIMDGMAGVTALAAAGQLKLAEAAEIAAAILQGFGLDANAMVNVADQIAKAAAMSAISVQDLGYSFKYVGPVAKAAGLSLAEVNAALVILGNSGIKGEQGGTAIRNMIGDLIAPSQRAADIIKELGLTIMDANGKMKPLADIIDQLKEKNIGLADGFKIWGVRFSEVLPLIQAGGDKIRGVTKQIAEANGEAQRMADTMLKGLAGSWTMLKGSVETLAISFGRLLQPAIEPIVQLMTELANKAIVVVADLDKASGAFKVFLAVLVGIPAAIGPLALAFAGISSVMGTIVSLGAATANGIAAIATAAASTYNAIVNLPGMISNIALALSSDMVGALTSGERALLMFGKAATIAAAAFVGWNLGQWMRDNIPAVRQFGDAVGDVLVNKMGIGNLALTVTGKMGELQKWIESTNAKLKEHGVVIQKGSMDWVAYAEALKAAGDKLGIFKKQINSNDLSFKGIETAMNSLEITASKTFSGVLNSMRLGSLGAQDQKLKIMELNNVIADVKVMHDKLNQSLAQGKITKDQYLVQETKLAQVMQQAKATMAELTGNTGKQTNAYARLNAEKEKTTTKTRELEQTLEKLAKTGERVAAELSGLPQTIADIANSSKNVKLLPPEWQEQADRIAKLKNLFKDLASEWRTALRQGNFELAAGIREQMELVEDAIEKQSKLFDNFKNVDAAEGLRKVGEAIDKYMIAKFDEAIKRGELLGPALSEAFANPLKEIEKWGDAIDFFGVETISELEKNAKKAADNFEYLNKAYQQGIVGIEAYKQAQLKVLETEIALGRARGENIDGMVKQAEVLKGELESLGGSITKTVQKAENEWSQLWQQISTIVTDLSRDLADAIWESQNLGEAFTKALDAMGKAVTRFVIEGLTKQLLKGLKESELATSSLGKTIDSVIKKIGGEGAGIGGPKVPTKPTGEVDLNQAANAFGSGLMGWISGIGAVVTSITGVLQYLQGRRMEQDIGRIEVSTRGLLAQTISIQETLNLYLPNLLNLQLLIPIKAILWEMLTGVETVAEAATAAASAPPSRSSDSSASGRGDGQGTTRPAPATPTPETMKPIDDFVETLPEVNDNLREMSFRANNSGLAMSAASERAGRGVGRVLPPLDRVGRGINDIQIPLGRLGQTAVDTSLNFLGLNIATTNLGKVYETLPAQIEPPFKALEEATDPISDFERNIWSTSKTLNSASFKMGRTVDDMTDKIETTFERLGEIGTTAFTVTQSMASEEQRLLQELAQLRNNTSGVWSDIQFQISQVNADLTKLRTGAKTTTLPGAYNPSLQQAGITFLPGGTLFPSQGTMQNLVPNTNLNLQVSVNNADAAQVANTMVDTWRRAGVNI